MNNNGNKKIHWRTLVKGICWEFSGFLTLGIAMWLWKGTWQAATKFALLYTSIRIILFYAHERIWKHIQWGKYKNNESK
jgi:uncharacterized membrane protein